METMFIKNKTTTTEKRKLKRLKRILPLMFFSVTVTRFMELRYITFCRRADTVWKIPGCNSNSFSIPVDTISWGLIKEFRKMVYIKPPEREYFYTKRCKVCDGIFFKNKISKEMSDNLWNNPNIEFHTSETEVCAEIASVCETHAEEYYKPQA